MDAEDWLHEERKRIEANEWSTEAPGGKGASVGNPPDLETYAKWHRLLALAGLSQRDSVPPGR